MKCMRPHHLGDFYMDGAELYNAGLNRQGNILLPNKNYELFEDWFEPIIIDMHRE